MTPAWTRQTGAIAIAATAWLAASWSPGLARAVAALGAVPPTDPAPIAVSTACDVIVPVSVDGRVVAGRVRGAPPVRGATIAPEAFHACGPAVTDADGRFALAGCRMMLPCGRFVAVVTAPGYPAQRVERFPTELDAVLVRLSRTAQPDAEPVECPGLAGRVPPDVLEAALVEPDTVAGWGEPVNPGVPIGPANPPRTALGLARAGAWHPLVNGLVFRVGCR